MPGFSIVSVLKCEILVHMAERERQFADFKYASILSRSLYLVVEKQDTENGRNEKTGPALLAMVKKQLAERRWKTRWHGTGGQ